ncbi:hypothetical protein [Priestia taiwanensis]|uniref:Uncharacterized protein n=1 Tax=Priestia taiwanensis TaxID=1347902 RepID=A0A917ASB2_9BACI|nr:hypothetical protein [Priestia taiwanensis]MBM7363934.1 hypothetical protein [Priestia taiwanensis]GGE70274.1 hypothetical protein GCM10007140_20250 [Priestia taiwanensis]
MLKKVIIGALAVGIALSAGTAQAASWTPKHPDLYDENTSCSYYHDQPLSASFL